MNELLSRILDAHGGMDLWNGYEKVEPRIARGGGFFALKGMLQDSNPRRMTVWLHDERSSVLPFGTPDHRTMFTPERIAIEKVCGGERRSFANEASGLYARTRSPADPRNVDSVYRHR